MWHTDVEERDIDGDRREDPEPLVAVGRLGDDADVRGELEEALDPLPDERLVIRERDANHGAPARAGRSARSVRPTPACASTSILPPIPSILSLSPDSPCPTLNSAAPRPSSLTVTATVSSFVSMDRKTFSAPAWRTAFVSASWTQRKMVWARAASTRRSFGEIEMHPRMRDAGDQGLQGAREIERRLLAHRAHDAPELDEELLGEGVRVVDRFLGLPVGDVSGELELQVQGGQVVAERVVKLTCNAQPLGGAGAVGEELARRKELGVHAPELRTCLRFAYEEPRSAKSEQLKAGIRKRRKVGRSPAVRAYQVDRHHRRGLRDRPDEPRFLADDERALARDDAEERPLEPGVADRERDERRHALRSERRRAPRAAPHRPRREVEGDRERSIGRAPNDGTLLEASAP